MVETPRGGYILFVASLAKQHHRGAEVIVGRASFSAKMDEWISSNLHFDF